MATRVRSHAKINLGLGIGSPRSDGYHELSTVYQTLELFDYVTVTAKRAVETTLRLTSNDERVPTDSRNTAWKMVDLALKALDLHAEVAIHIEKRLPVQGGMGAGSANAAAALLGLEVELEVSIPNSLALAARVGSDVPLFLVGGTVMGLDRGQEVQPLPDLEPICCVIATPDVGVSTPQAFRDWDALCVTEGLTDEASTDKLNRLSRTYASAFAVKFTAEWQANGSSGVLSEGKGLAGLKKSALVRTGILSWIKNDFERVVFPQHPFLSEIKRILEAPGTPEAALHASLSGSGSALFGLYQTRRDAEAALDRLQAAGVKGQLTNTMPRQRYWGEMLL